ncbi:hypothetical protein BJ742DRAFT_876612 [Cladochytrium replicatum]|nr:hypothetical protein BJ742DRAFT_876612 [Cladochytrium replicatum]
MERLKSNVSSLLPSGSLIPKPQRRRGGIYAGERSPRPMSDEGSSDQDDEGDDATLEGSRSDAVARSPLEQMLFELLFAMVYKNDSVPEWLERFFSVSEDAQFVLQVLEDAYGLHIPRPLLLAIHIFGFQLDPSSWTQYLSMLIVSFVLVYLWFMNMIYTSRSLKDSTGAVWPLKTVRMFAAALTSFLYLPMLETFLFGLSCDYSSSDLPLARLNGASGYLPTCLNPVQLILSLISIITLSLFVPVSLALGLTYYEADPGSEIGKAHVAVNAFAYKYTLIRLGVQLFAYILLFILIARFQPSYDWRNNHIRCGFFGFGILGSIVCIIYHFMEHNDTEHTLVLGVVAAAVVVGFGLGFSISALVKRRVIAGIQKRLDKLHKEDEEENVFSLNGSDAGSDTDSDPNFGKLRKHTPVFTHWTDMELFLRHELHEVVHKKRVLNTSDFARMCELVQQAATDHPFATGPHIHFVMYLRTFAANAIGLLTMHLRKSLVIGPVADLRFLVYSLFRNLQQQRQSTDAGFDVEMRVVNEFEYRKYWRAATKYHKQAAELILRAWKVILTESQNDLRPVLNLAQDIASSIKRANSSFETLVSRFPTDQAATMAYIRFLVDIKNDMKKAEDVMLTVPSQRSKIASTDDTMDSIMELLKKRETKGKRATMNLNVFKAESESLNSLDSNYASKISVTSGNEIAAPQRAVRRIERQHARFVKRVTRRIWAASAIVGVLVIVINLLLAKSTKHWSDRMDWDVATANAAYDLIRLFRDMRRVKSAFSDLNPYDPPNAQLVWSELLGNDTINSRASFQFGRNTEDIPLGNDVDNLTFITAITELQISTAMVSADARFNEKLNVHVSEAMDYVLNRGRRLPFIYQDISAIERERQIAEKDIVLITMYGILPGIRELRTKQLALVQVFKRVPRSVSRGVIVGMKDKISKIKEWKDGVITVDNRSKDGLSIEQLDGETDSPDTTEQSDKKAQGKDPGGKGTKHQLGQGGNLEQLGKRNDVGFTLYAIFFLMLITLLIKDILGLMLVRLVFEPAFGASCDTFMYTNTLRVQLVMQHALSAELIVNDPVTWSSLDLIKESYRDQTLTTLSCISNAVLGSRDSLSYSAVWGSQKTLSSLAKMPYQPMFIEASSEFRPTLLEAICQYHWDTAPNFIRNNNVCKSAVVTDVQDNATLNEPPTDLHDSTATWILAGPMLTSSVMARTQHMLQQLAFAYIWLMVSIPGNFTWDDPGFQFIDATTEPVVKYAFNHWLTSIGENFRRDLTSSIVSYVILFSGAVSVIIAANVFAYRLIKEFESQTSQVCTLILMIPTPALAKLTTVIALSHENMNGAGVSRFAIVRFFLNIYNWVKRNIKIAEETRQSSETLSTAQNDYRSLSSRPIEEDVERQVPREETLKESSGDGSSVLGRPRTMIKSVVRLESPSEYLEHQDDENPPPNLGRGSTFSPKLILRRNRSSSNFGPASRVGVLRKVNSSTLDPQAPPFGQQVQSAHSDVHLQVSEANQVASFHSYNLSPSDVDGNV